MKLKLFSTQRQIRKYLDELDNTLLDKYKTIGEFLGDIIVIKDKKFIDNDLRKFYLFKAIENIDISKLGFKKEFLSFFKDSEFIFGFLKEIFIEKVEIDDIIMSDIYVEYEEHLNIIKNIKKEYKILLDENGYIDTFLIDEFYINEKLLENIDEIEIYLDGYLSKFDCEILDKIDKKITIYTTITKFNQNLVSKFLKNLEIGYKYQIDYHSKEIIFQEKIEKYPIIEVSYFSKKFDEINFVFAKIAEFIESGIEADKIAVILPDESFSELLEEFDEFKNLNFAMGKSFTHSNLYIKLKSIYLYLINEDEVDKLKAGEWLEEFNNSEDIIEFIRNKATNKELKIIDEELFKISKFKDMFDKKMFLHFILNRFKELKFDDIYSGKITVMGVLESRGIEFDGVILLNFNDGVVPNVNSKDLFLNTSIRKIANLPTRMDKENLQKHYYYSLIKNSKKVAISYIDNEEESVSRFLYELDLDIGKNEEDKYKEIVYKYSLPRNLPFWDEEFEVKYPLTPTSLKTLLTCPRKYYFSKILDIEDNSEAELNFGSIFHDAIEEIVKNKDNINSSDEYYNELMNQIYLRFNTKKEIFEVRTKWEDSIKEFCKNDFEKMKYSNQIVEKWLNNFEIDNIPLSAKIDRIDLNETSITLIDYKTGKIDNVLKDKFDFQLTFYYLWAKKNYPNKKIITAYYNMQEAKFIEVSPKIDELKEAISNITTYATQTEDIKNCKYCIYKEGCGR